MSFYTSLNGLKNAQTSLNVISHNIANGETNGFKKSRVEFSDIVAGTAYTNPKLIQGVGATVEAIQQNFALGPIEHSSRDPNSMGLAPLSIAAATAGDHVDASKWFERNLKAHVVQPPFDVRTETAKNNTGYFLTASGGMLQNILYGFTGLRIEPKGLVPVYPPMLPARWTAFTLRNASFRGRHYDISVRRDAGGKPVLSMTVTPSTGSPRP